jgi:hypothetical protein
LKNFFLYTAFFVGLSFDENPKSEKGDSGQAAVIIKVLLPKKY